MHSKLLTVKTGVVNCFVALKLYTYLQSTQVFIDYFFKVFENIIMLCAFMLLIVASFAWLISAASSGTPASVQFISYGNSFLLVVRLLLDNIDPSSYYDLTGATLFTLDWTYYFSQIALNLILVKIASPICYLALVGKDGVGFKLFAQARYAADFVKNGAGHILRVYQEREEKKGDV